MFIITLLTVDEAVELVEDAAGEAVAPLPAAKPAPPVALAFAACVASVAAFSCFS